jgi:hypothetical protein
VNEIDIKVRLELHASEDAISGVISSQGEAPVAFSGWIGLVAAIDDLVENEKRDAKSVTPTS